MIVPSWSTTVESGPLALLFGLFAIKHVLADFPLQSQWMVYGKERRTGWLLPLLTHSAVHGAGTLAILVALRPRLWLLALADVVVHFVIDKTKATINQRYDLTPNDSNFWLLLGTDQTLHHLTGFILALIVATNL